MAESSIIVGTTSHLEHRSIQILSIEADPTIQSGLITCLNRFADLQVAAAADNPVTAWQILTAGAVEIDLILLGLPAIDRVNDATDPQLSPIQASFAFCQQVKASAKNLPILVLIAPQHPAIAMAFQIGIEGCCLRGSSVLDLVAAIRQVAAGQTSWSPEILQYISVGASPRSPNSEVSFRDRLRLSSLDQIERTLAELAVNLQGELSAVDRLFLAGRRRELNTARWLIKRLLPATASTMAPALDPIALTIPSVPIDRLTTTDRANADTQTLFDRIAAKLQSSLENLTPTPLEIDILRLEKKRELFYLILRKFEGLLEELRFSQVTIDQLSSKQSMILQDLWAAVTTDFFGRYYTESILVPFAFAKRLPAQRGYANGDREVEIIPTLLQEIEIVHTEILAKIPQSIELFNYLLFKSPLTIDNAICPAGSVAAAERACALLENLTIQMANAVMQPVLNRFGNLESLKANFYDRRLLSSREIERFRNDLSWRYRIERYIGEPQAIFESQHRLFVFTTYGINRIAIYAPRPQELATLSGLPLAVTLTLELRDALSPRLRSATTFLGSSIVYLLTEIIGRGIGLIGRGIIKGVGNIWQESNRIRK
jgi:DNA-binding NarL/FixJ family response regulator